MVCIIKSLATLKALSFCSRRMRPTPYLQPNPPTRWAALCHLCRECLSIAGCHLPRVGLNFVANLWRASSRSRLLKQINALGAHFPPQYLFCDSDVVWEDLYHKERIYYTDQRSPEGLVAEESFSLQVRSHILSYTQNRGGVICTEVMQCSGHIEPKKNIKFWWFRLTCQQYTMTQQ